MTDDVMAFGGRALTAEDVTGKDVLEVGSMDVGGSFAPIIEGLAPKRYLQTDMRRGHRVGMVLDVVDVVDRLGAESFDVVFSTETFEHVKDWVAGMENMKQATRPGGVVILTVPTPGQARHAFPDDYWRFDEEAMKKIFADWTIEMLETNPFPKAGPRTAISVYVKARKPEGEYEPVTLVEEWARSVPK